MRDAMTAEISNGYRGTRGHAMVEVALMLPWILLLFVGIVEFGFYTYAAI
jgi:Flp pilus assembly protein TadG